MRLELSAECLVRAFSCAPPPELVDGRVSQRSVEPRNDGFVCRRLLRSCNHLRECILQDVLGERAVTDPRSR